MRNDGMRNDGRSENQPRPIEIQLDVQKNPEGSLIYQCGGTRVLIAASIDESVPGFLRGSGKGWLTAEYAMHPRANPNRQGRDSRKGHIDGRSQEIQRLIGRSLRSALRLDKLGERSITIDCDVLDADGGTRTAAITGGYVALLMALDHLRKQGKIGPGIVRAHVLALSCGIVSGKTLVDLNYLEDSKAEVDMNVVGTPGGSIVEVQGTAEDAPVPKHRFDELVDAALSSFGILAEKQLEALRSKEVDVAWLTKGI